MKIILERNDVIELRETYEQVGEGKYKALEFECSISRRVKGTSKAVKADADRIRPALLDEVFGLNKGTFYRIWADYISHTCKLTDGLEDNQKEKFIQIDVDKTPQGWNLVINGKCFTIDELCEAAQVWKAKENSIHSL